MHADKAGSLDSDDLPPSPPAETFSASLGCSQRIYPCSSAFIRGCLLCILNSERAPRDVPARRGSKHEMLKVVHEVVEFRPPDGR
jgi:hypothetical protein